MTQVTKESLSARIAELESGTRSIKEDYQLEAYRMLLKSMADNSIADEDDNFYSWFGREWHENYQHNQYTTAAKQMLGVMAESAWNAATCRAMALVKVPDVKRHEDISYEVGRFKTHRESYCDGWNACRLAMLNIKT
ncbi:hypothetical protein MXL28_17425 [Klebsiella aerogenes]|uniref:hypothetical protein n=1 Tax=Klebsiella aerogenes TaxID=548 RepID=UPI002DB7BC21|nr:hypothetical protein [Klebsiella aerogenes]MEB6655072.1 hypothetical protein [Klebsiella aerogenes]